MKRIALALAIVFAAISPAQCVDDPINTSVLQFDPDYLFAGLDESIGGSFPAWLTRWRQENTTDPTSDFAGEDNSQNGIQDDDHLALLAAILDGEPVASVLGGVSTVNINDIRASYTSNRAKVRPDLTLNIFIVTVNIIDEINKDDPAFGESLQDLVAAYMTIGDQESVAYIRGLLITLGEIFVEVGVANGDIPALAESITKSTLRSTVNANFVATRYACFGDATGATKPNVLGDTGNIGGSAATNEQEYAAQGGNREAWLAAKGITAVPLHIVTPPTDLTVEAGEPVALTAAVAGGDGGTTGYDWKRVNESNGATTRAATSAALSFVYPLAGDAGLYRYFVCDGTWIRQALPRRLTVNASAFRITTQPQGGSASEGGSFSFNVDVRGGTALPEYSWYYGATPGALNLIDGESGKTLTLDGLVEGDAGYYQARITSGGVTLTSNTVQLTVQLDVDTTPPALTLIGANPLVLECGAQYAEPGAQAIDNTDGDISGDIEISGAGSIDGVGNYTITYRVADAAGNESVEERSVVVADTTPPALELLGANPLVLSCKSAFTDPGASATDACDTAIGTKVQSSGSVNTAVPGNYTRDYSVTDASGNTTILSRSVQVVDTVAPQITRIGPATITLTCGGALNDPGATASDACAGDLSGAIQAAGVVDINTPGQYTRVYTVTDPSENTASVQRTFVVSDTTPPVLTLNGTSPLQLACGSVFTDPGAMALDACDGAVGGVLVGSGNVNTNSPGTYQLIYEAFDRAGNRGEVARQVKVVDASPPTVTLNGLSAVTLACGEVFNDPGATATDSCDTSTLTVSPSGEVGTAPGSYTRIYTATDASGNTGSVTRSITVEDKTAPVLTLNGAAVVDLDCGGNYTELGAGAFDACESQSRTVTISGTVNTSQAGEYTLSYFATDTAGNTGSVTRTVRVRAAQPIIDIDVVDNLLVLDCGSGFTVPSYTATVPCKGDVTPSVVVRDVDKVDTGSPGDYPVYFDVSDNGANPVTATLVVRVVDTTPPQLSLAGDAAITLACGEAFADPGANAIDACDGDLTQSITVDGIVDTTTPGEYTIEYRVQDTAGNAATVQRIVSVVGAQTPELTLLGAGQIELSCDDDYVEPGFAATDVCGGDATPRVSVAGAVISGKPGTYTLTYTLDAADGGPALATRAVSVLSDCAILIEREPQDLTLYTGMTLQLYALATGGSGTLTYQWYYEAGLGGPALPLSSGQTLLVPDLTLADAGGYYCVIGDGFTEVTTRTAQLSVFEPAATGQHTGDQNGDWSLSLAELLRMIQFYNSFAFHCEDGTEDGYAPLVGDETCTPHDTDYNPQNWIVSLAELLRAIQFYNSPGSAFHREEGTEDGFAPGAG